MSLLSVINKDKHRNTNKSYSEMAQTLALDFLSTFESGAFCDLEFAVGPQACIVKAHKLVLRTRSPVFVSMLDERWKTENGGVIKLPDYKLQPFKIFLKFLYCDKLEDEINDVEDLIELLHMGKMYVLDGLFNQASQRLRLKMQNELNSLLRIYDILLNVVPNLAEEAFSIIKRNAGDVIIQSDVQNISCIALKTILEEDEINVEEINLFNAVSRWIGGDKFRKCEAKIELIPLIRFQLITLQEFEKSVIPSGLLSQKEMTHLIQLYTNKSVLFTLDDLQFKFRSRNPKVAKDSHQLKILLNNALPGDVIQLVGGQEYIGNFHITNEKKFITLEGQSGKDAPIIFGDNLWGLILDGSCCKISNIRISDNVSNKNSGIIVRGFGNILENLQIEIRKYGVYLDKAIKCKLSNILLVRTQEEHIGLCLNCCTDIKIDKVKSNMQDADQKVMFTEIMPGCDNIRMSNCESSNSLNISGNNVKLINVYIRSQVIVNGDGHKFLDSSAKRWINIGNEIEFVNCCGITVKAGK